MATKRTTSKARTVDVKLNGVTVKLDYARHTPFAKLAQITARFLNVDKAPYTDTEFLRDFQEAIRLYLDDKTYERIFTPEKADDIYENMDMYMDVYGALKAARETEAEAFSTKFASLFNPDMD